MNVLFLDVDGVLNKFYNQEEDSFQWEDAYPKFSITALNLLKRLVEEENLVIVLSSTWRLMKEDKDSIERLLDTYNLKIFDVTPYINYHRETTRAMEIRQWLDNRKDIEAFIILDDEDGFWSLENHFIRTNASKGFVYSDFVVAKGKLANQRDKK